MTGNDILERMGFSRERLMFTLRTAVAACCAVYIAWLIGLEHPQWSGMSVWASSLPLRGHLLERSLFRVLGTVIGALVGVALLFAANGENWIVVPGLALWIGLCAGAGNIVRGFASYGAMLAGFSAAMVTLLHSSRSESLLAVGIDRVLTVLLGVAAALLVGWLFAKPGDADDPALKVRRLTGRLLRALAAAIEDGGDSHSQHRQLLREMAEIEDQLDNHPSGPLRSRHAIRSLRAILFADVRLLLWIDQGDPPEESTALAEALDEVADAFEAPFRPEAVSAALARAEQLSVAIPVLHEGLADIQVAIANEGTSDLAIGTEAWRISLPILHRDWAGASQALLRATGVILVVGIFWLLTGWQAGAFMLLGTAIMTTIFSTADNPAATLRVVLAGQTLGVAGALVCRWLVWPWATSESGVVLLMMPFILIGGMLYGHRRGAGPLGYDYNMIVLLMLQPAWPLAGSLMQSLGNGVAVILGPAIGLVAFLLVFPISGKRRQQALLSAMINDLEAMARTRGAVRRKQVWHARYCHRVLRLVRLADKYDSGNGDVADAGLALHLIGMAILRIDGALEEGEISRRTTRRLELALAELGRLSTDPADACKALANAADHLKPNDGDVNLFRKAAALLDRYKTEVKRSA